MNASILDLRDYIAILRRRKAQLVIPMVVILLIAVGLAFGLPPLYRASATILIEQQDIPQDLVRTTVTSYADERIQIIGQRVMTRENLWKIVEKYDLFPEERARGDAEEIISHMRDNIEISMVSVDIIDPKSGRPSKATISFDLSFQYSDPQATKEVVDELVALYLQENLKIRSQVASETSGFLSEEADRLSAYIAELEARLAQFKEKNTGQLPELMTLNLNLMDRTERDLDDAQRELSNLEERKIYLESQLAQLEPNTGDSPEGRLRALQMQYLKALAVYGPDHPDMINMRREIEILKAQVGNTDNSAGLEAQILQVQSDLAAAREKYSEDHPDVVKLKKSLLMLNDELNKSRASGDGVVTSTFQPDNPAYVATKTQLEAVKTGLNSAKEKRDSLKAKLDAYENRITQMPRVEQEGMALRREYDNTVQKYHEIKQKLLEAQVSEQLEKDNKGERFSLMDSPIVPLEPYKPNRPRILLLGVALSFLAGLGFVSVMEYMDKTVRGSKGIVAILGSPPIATIPYIKIEGEAPSLNNRRIFLFGALVLIVLVLVLRLVQFFQAPS
jgi:uncharacterized protein involved in exopolysaccharide biosynthesis